MIIFSIFSYYSVIVYLYSKDEHIWMQNILLFGAI